MTTYTDAWNAGIDAIIADPTLNRGGFVDAIQTVITIRFNNAAGNAWCDAVATLYQSLGLINNPTYGNLRNKIANDGETVAKALFAALGTIASFPETQVAIDALRLIDLRTERDNVDAALARLDVLIAAEPNGVVGRQVKDVMREGKRNLRTYKQQIRDQIRVITGDPDN
jgi:hypothetical protein